MIDTHNHILPGVDDGAQSYDESLEMLKALEEHGVNKVMLTPHYAPLRGFHKSHSDLLIVFNELKRKMFETSLNIEIFLGSEVDFSKTIENDLLVAPTLNETNAVLIDFGYGSPDIEEAVYELSLKGYKIVIAHPERYRNTSIATWKRIRKQGGLLQVSAKHLIKRGSKSAQKQAIAFLKADMIDLVATDLHDIKDADTMKKAFKKIQKKKSLETAQRLFYKTPNQIISGNVK